MIVLSGGGMQLSSVCTKFAEAASLAPCLQYGLDIAFAEETKFRPSFNEQAHGQLGSQLLQRWAGRVTSLAIDESCFATPGAHVFVAAAARLTHVKIQCSSLLAAAQIEDLLSGSRSVTSLCIMGMCKPGLLPPSVQTLDVAFENLDDEAIWDPEEPSAFLFRVSRLPLLQTLKLEFDQGLHDIALACSVKFKNLQELHISLQVRDALLLDLSWVLLQSCDQLHLTIILGDLPGDKHGAVVEEVRKLRVARLTLRVCVPLTKPLQELWFSLPAKSWHIEDCHSVFTHFSPGIPLQVLPRCAGIIRIRDSKMNSGRPFTIIWSALTAFGANIIIDMGWCYNPRYPLRKVHVLGGGDVASDNLQQPWQLLICTARAVHGLPASQPTESMFFLQNNAAAAAGWAEGHEHCNHPGTIGQ